MTEEEKAAIENTKDLACDLTEDLLRHYIEHHTNSEREQELLEDFGRDVMQTIHQITTDDGEEEYAE